MGHVRAAAAMCLPAATPSPPFPRRLSPLFPLLIQKAPITPLFPLHTQIVGGWGLKFESAAPPLQVILSIALAVARSAKHLTIIDSVTYPINVGAPTFPHRESHIFYSLLSNFLAPAAFLPHLKLITVNLQRNVGAPTFSNCSSKGAGSERGFQGTGRWTRETWPLSVQESRTSRTL